MENGQNSFEYFSDFLSNLRGLLSSFFISPKMQNDFPTIHQKKLHFLKSSLNLAIQKIRNTLVSTSKKKKMNIEEQKNLSDRIGLSDAHWAVINREYEQLEKILSNKATSAADKTSEMLFTGQEQRDSRIFIAGDFFFPPDKIENFPLNINFDKGSYPLHFAAAMGDEAAINLLIKYKSNLNVKDGIGATPLHLACFYGQLVAAKLLLNSKTKINELTKTKKSLVFYDAGTTALHAALFSGNIDLVKWLIDQGADINLKTKFGCDAYFFAARSGNPKIVQLLADKGIQIPNLGVYGNFPLLEAVKKNSYETVELLLKLGSPIREPQGHEAPLMRAIENNYLDIRKLLIQHGAKPIDFKGNLSQAARSNDTTYINEYYQAKKDINKVFGDATALMSAAANGKIEAVQLLLSLGADVNINPGGTALHWALANNYYEIANLLLDHNADCSLVDDYGNSVLFNAISYKVPDRKTMVLRMIALGANPHSKSKHGGSAYSIAQRENDTEIIEIFDGVSSKNAVDLSYVAPAFSIVLKNLVDNYEWKSVYQELWDELVPPSGPSNSLQGQLLVCIGKLSDEFFRNGNINWDHNKANYLEMISFLKTHLLDGSISVNEKELQAAFVKLTHFNVVHYEKSESPHSKIAEIVVLWCAGHRDLIKYE